MYLLRVWMFETHFSLPLARTRLQTLKRFTHSNLNNFRCSMFQSLKPSMLEHIPASSKLVGFNLWLFECLKFEGSTSKGLNVRMFWRFERFERGPFIYSNHVTPVACPRTPRLVVTPWPSVVPVKCAPVNAFLRLPSNVRYAYNKTRAQGLKVWRFEILEGLSVWMFEGVPCLNVWMREGLKWLNLWHARRFEGMQVEMVGCLKVWKVWRF